MQHLHFYLDQEKYAIIKPKLVFSGFLKDVKDWTSFNHSHDFCEIMYIVSGSGLTKIADTEYAIKTNDIIIYNPRILHEEIAKSKDFHIVFFAVDNLKIPNLPEGNLISDDTIPIISAEKYDSIIKIFFETLMKEIEKKETGYKAIATNLASAIVFYIMRFKNMSIENSEILELLTKSREYIAEHYSKELNLDELAESVHLSKFYFVHLFKEFFSISPIKYHSMVRLDQAKKLLLNTNLSITEISAKVGYEDYSTFLRAFKNKEKMSPNQCRNGNNNKIDKENI